MNVNANQVGIDTDDPDFIVVGFAWKGRDPYHYRTLQRAYEFDEQDVALGMDSYHVEKDDQKYSAYGGILRFQLHRDRALISLDTKTARKLDGEPELEIRFDLGDEQFEDLRAGLTAVFKGFDCFADLAS
jgi:Immunity protein 10